MKSITHGKDISGVEVTHISKHGLWLLTRDNELFISFKEFPWFQDTSVSKIMNVEQPNPNFLHWPDLDVDLAIESLRCFPLASKTTRPTIRPGRLAKREPITRSKSVLRSTPRRTSSKEQNTIFPRIPHFPATISHVKDDERDPAQSTD
jgi:hypothetical protein